MIYDKVKGRWESISAWFAGKEDLEFEVGKVLDTTNEIIRKITRYATRISEERNQSEKLTKMFRKCCLFMS